MKNLNTIGFLIAFIFLAACSKDKETAQPDPELNNFNLLEIKKKMYLSPLYLHGKKQEALKME